MKQMTFVNHNDVYFKRMDNSIKNKTNLLNWVRKEDLVIAELGAGSGILVEEIIKINPNVKITAIDASEQSILKMSEKFKDSDVEIRQAVLGLDECLPKNNFDVVIASSIFHEVYSFLGIDSLKKLTKEIYDSLKIGGSFLLRDGVKPDNSYNLARVKITDSELFELAMKYCDEAPVELHPVFDNYFIGSKHQIAEMLFTINWGEGSFDREVKEQYQIFELDEAVDFYESFGFKNVYKNAFIQDGYVKNLVIDKNCDIEVLNEEWESWFPDTNAIWVFEKENE